MAKICDTCDTKLRLGLCNGKKEEFKYCFRKVGSLDELEETITPFDSLDQLCQKQNHIQEESLSMEEFSDEHMGILMGRYADDTTNSIYPVGFIIK